MTPPSEDASATGAYIILTPKRLTVLIIAYFVIAIGTALVVGLVIRSGIDKTTGNITQGQISACNRANIQAARDNRSQFADWTIDKLFITAIEHPTTPQGRGTKSDRSQATLVATFGPLVKAAVAAKAWVPLQHNCQAVIAAHGAQFLPAQPIRFEDRLPPVTELAIPPAHATLPAARLLKLLQDIH